MKLDFIEKASIGLVITWIVLIITAFAGWITNIVNVVGGLTALERFVDISGLLVLQIVGILVFPLGSVLGVISWF